MRQNQQVSCEFAWTFPSEGVNQAQRKNGGIYDKLNDKNISSLELCFIKTSLWEMNVESRAKLFNLLF